MGHAVQWYLETWGHVIPMEVHHPGVHVPPADEAGGIVTRTATHMFCDAQHSQGLGAVLGWSVNWRHPIGGSAKVDVAGDGAAPVGAKTKTKRTTP